MGSSSEEIWIRLKYNAHVILPHIYFPSCLFDVALFSYCTASKRLFECTHKRDSTCVWCFFYFFIFLLVSIQLWCLQTSSLTLWHYYSRSVNVALHTLYPQSLWKMLNCRSSSQSTFCSVNKEIESWNSLKRGNIPARISLGVNS